MTRCLVGPSRIIDSTRDRQPAKYLLDLDLVRRMRWFRFWTFRWNTQLNILTIRAESKKDDLLMPCFWLSCHNIIFKRYKLYTLFCKRGKLWSTIDCIYSDKINIQLDTINSKCINVTDEVNIMFVLQKLLVQYAGRTRGTLWSTIDRHLNIGCLYIFPGYHRASSPVARRLAFL